MERRQWACLVLGHEPNEVAASFGYDECRRCYLPMDRPVMTVEFHGLWPWFRYWVFRPAWVWILQTWWKTAPCRDCGSLPDFGERCDCMPF